MKTLTNFDLNCPLIRLHLHYLPLGGDVSAQRWLSCLSSNFQIRQTLIGPLNHPKESHPVSRYAGPSVETGGGDESPLMNPRMRFCRGLILFEVASENLDLRAPFA